MLEYATTDDLLQELSKRHKFVIVYTVIDENGPQYKIARFCNTVELSGFSKILDIDAEDYIRRTRT